ncbi:hypothetical protein NliqN6_3853 [Naganishia liquefaciens]|uniref:HpcH/HpaI aldolase/citrate lyase domain-containing protein n=1 Tax=Naganishia liquefaciens TaxID=104408 RepID=A0A8H3TTW4_9TREE|nr:hypothetical protein NliqN6_3853 [Naganishia liquefaciens]
MLRPHRIAQSVAGPSRIQSRSMISSTKPKDIPRGSLLYVPASSPKFLRSSLSSTSQTITYDLEDSVHASAKASARESLIEWLAHMPAQGIQGKGLNGLSIAVRPNSPFLALEGEHEPESAKDQRRETVREKAEAGRDGENVGLRDVMHVWGSDGARRINEGAGPMMLLPKVDHPSMLTEIDHMIVSMHGRHPHPKTPLIASIESPESLMNIGSIAGWRGRGVELVGLTFAAEDFCASSHILRSPSRMELLYARSNIVTAARTFGLAAIDMVCVDYKDLAILQEEAEEGRRLGFDGKQAIHPSQVETIRKAFAPSEAEVYRAALILYKMANSTRGAEGIKGKDGKEEMIDKPMILQASSRAVVRPVAC